MSIRVINNDRNVKYKRLKMIIRFLFAVVLVSGCSSGVAVLNQPLKVLTYNIHHANPPSKEGYIDMAAVANVIRKADADLVALQELDVNNSRSGSQLDQAAELGRLTGMHHFFAKGIDYRGGEYGIAILSKYPFTDTQRYALPMKENTGGEPRTLALVMIEPEKGKQIAFANTHLDLHEENRLVQAEFIVNILKTQTAPVIFCGDLNAEPGSPVLQIFQQILETKSDDGPTYPEKTPLNRLDYIMYTPQQFQLEKQHLIPEQYASDHWPVYAEFSW